jgi:CHRD domain
MTAHRASTSLAALGGLLVFGAAAAASAQDLQLFAVLSGGNEVSPTGQAAAGDLDGGGGAAVNVVAADELCFAILVNNIDPPTFAHIHQGAAGVNGPIVVNLTPPNSAGCVPGLDPALVDSIRRAPSQFYVNVHTGPFPAGAVRGQLF